MPAAIAVPAIFAAGSTIAGIFGTRSNNKAVSNAARVQQQQNNYAAELEAKATEEALKFARESEATRRSEFDRTQGMNRDLYDRADALAREQQAWERERYNQEVARKEPFRKFGLGAIAGLGKPIYAPGTAPGTLGSMFNKQK